MRSVFSKALAVLGAMLGAIALGGCCADSNSTGKAFCAMPTVTALQVTVDRLRYGTTATFTIADGDTAALAKLSADKCADVALQGRTGDATRTATCTVSGTGELRLDGRDATGLTLFTRTFTVPQPQVTMTTTLGTMVVELDPAAAPLSVSNFVRYVNDGFYDGTIFHRVIAGFVAQGGWVVTTPSPAVKPGARAAIALESNRRLSNLRGTIAMARTTEPDSATSQFYFNLADNTFLDWVSAAAPGYAVFGKIVQGLDVMDRIGATPTATRFGLPNVPLTDVVVQKAEQTR